MVELKRYAEPAGFGGATGAGTPLLTEHSLQTLGRSQSQAKTRAGQVARLAALAGIASIGYAGYSLFNGRRMEGKYWGTFGGSTVAGSELYLRANNDSLMNMPGGNGSGNGGFEFP